MVQDWEVQGIDICYMMWQTSSMEGGKMVKCPLPWQSQANCSHADGQGNCEAEPDQQCQTLQDGEKRKDETSIDSWV